MVRWQKKRRLLVLLISISVFNTGFTPSNLYKKSSHSSDSMRNKSFQVSSKPSDLNYSWSLFHPVWKHSQKDSPNNSQSKYISLNQINKLIGDPNKLLEPTFKIPTPLKHRVLFWTSIYSRFDENMKVVHDRHNPGIIYGYIDFNPLIRLKGRYFLTPGRIEKTEKYIIKQIQHRVRAAYRHHSFFKISPREARQIRHFYKSHGLSRTDNIIKRSNHIRTQTGQRNHFLSALKRSKHLLPKIEWLFKKHGLPLGLTRIPFVESSFNNIALSKVGAFGIWQFMPNTARYYIKGKGRRHWSNPLRQTMGAIRLLKQYRRSLGDWGLTITAYNSGVGRIRKLSRRYKLSDSSSLLTHSNIKNDLGFAGRNFLSEVLAANLVVAYKAHLFDTPSE